MAKRDQLYPRVRLAAFIRDQLDAIRKRERLPASYPYGRIIAGLATGRFAPIRPPDPPAPAAGHSSR